MLRLTMPKPIPLRPGFRELRARYIDAQKHLADAQETELVETRKADGTMTPERHVAMVGTVYSARIVQQTGEAYQAAFRDDLLASDAEYRRLWTRLQSVRVAVTEARALWLAAAELHKRTLLHVPEANAIHEFTRPRFAFLRARIGTELKCALDQTREALSSLELAEQDADAEAFAYFEAALDTAKEHEQ